MNKVDQQNEHFQTISQEYYAARKSKNHLKYKKLMFHYMFSSIAVNKKRKLLVLEPMCGYGEGEKIVRAYLTRNFEYEGFDYSDTLIHKAKEKRPRLNIYKQDVTKFNPTKQYDIIILLGGLHHVPDYAESICRNLSGSLRKGGIFINFEPTNNNVFIKIVRNMIYRKNHLFDEETERAFSLKQYNRMFIKNGFQIKKQYYPGLLGYILYYNPDAFPLLNVGSEKTVKRIFNAEKRLYDHLFGKLFSFCTFSIFVKI